MFNKDYASYYDLFNFDKPYEKEIKFVYEWAGKPKSIFDIGAGTGNYWKYYPKEIEIIGVDKSKTMVKRANNEGHYICKADITKYKHILNEKFDCATALFDVLNYIPIQTWWKNIPVKKGGYWIFDIWDKEKVDRDGFVRTTKTNGTTTRIISPIKYDGKSVELDISVFENDFPVFNEIHTMYIWSEEDIVKFCGKEFEIVGTRPTAKWQTWWKCRRK